MRLTGLTTICRGDDMTRQDGIEELKRLREEERKAIFDAYRSRTNSLRLYTKLLNAEPTSYARSQGKDEARWRDSGSFWVNLRRGTYHDFTPDGYGKGGVISAVRNIIGCDYVAAIRYLRDDLGLPIDGPVPQVSEEERQRREAASIEAIDELRDGEAKNLDRAKALWVQGRHISGTPGYKYLVIERAIGAAAVDSLTTDIVRWHDGQRMLMFAATDDAGEFVGIQRIAVNPDGTKDYRWRVGKGFKAKLSLGPVGRGFVRLPGKVAGAAELQTAEGPETALSAWASNGIETWIALGGRLVKPPIGRHLIYLRDDDKRNPKTERQRRQTLRDWRKEGLSFVDANPFEYRVGQKQDFNDLLIQRGHLAVAARIALFAYEQSPVSRDYAPLDDVRKALGDAVRGVVDEWASFNPDDGAPLVYALKVTVGGGKSQAALENIYQRLKIMRAAGDNRVFIYLVPYHELGAKLIERWRGIAGDEFKPAIWRGRESKKPNARDKDDRMCERIDDVRKAQKMRVKVGEELCAHCSLKDECRYMAQRQQEGDIWFMAHPAMFSRVPKTIGAKNIAGVIVDETPWQSGIIPAVDIPLSLLEDGAMPVPTGDGPLGGARLASIRGLLKTVVDKIAIGIEKGETRHITRAALSSVGFEDTTGAEGIKMEGYREVTDGPPLERVLNKTVGPMMMVWAAIRDLLSGDNEAADRLVVELNDDNALVLSVMGKSDIHEDWNKPTLLIDASLQPDILKLFWPSVQVVGEFQIDAPYMRVHQVQGRAFSKTMLAPLNGDPITDDAKKLARYKSRSRRSVRAYILKMARINGGRTLVVSNLSIVEALSLPAHIETAHFNALAGLDDFGDVRTVIVIGRTQPPPREVEAMAGALTGRVVDKLADGVWYPTRDATRFKRTPAGLVPVVGETEGHPDAMAELIRHRICEGEVEQAIGRARGINRTADKPLDVYLLSDVALDLPIDEFLEPEDVTTPAPLDLMLSEGGIAFNDGASASTAYASLWRTAEAAKKAMQRQRCGTLPKITTFLGNVPNLAHPGNGLAALTFQKVGAGCRPQTAWCDLEAHPNPRAAVEALVGPVVYCEVQTSAPPPDDGRGLDGDYPATAQLAVLPIAEAHGEAIAVAVSETADAAEFVAECVAPVAQICASTIEPTLAPVGAEVAQPEVTIPPAIWTAVWTHARDCDLSHNDVAEEWCGVSGCHLSNIEGQRRKATPELLAALNRFLTEARPIQQRLL